MSGTIRLHGTRGSSCTRRVSLTLALKGIEHEFVSVDVARSEHRSAEFRRINPHGRMPVLEIDGLCLTQSVAICEYVEETRPSPPLLPSEPAGRALCRTIVETINADIQPMQNRGTLEYIVGRYADSSVWEAERPATGSLPTWPAYWIGQGLETLEEFVKQGGGVYCVGDEVTLADVFLIPQLSGARNFGLCLDVYPTLRRIESALRRHPALEHWLSSKPV